MISLLNGSLIPIRILLSEAFPVGNVIGKSRKGFYIESVYKIGRDKAGRLTAKKDTV